MQLNYEIGAADKASKQERLMPCWRNYVCGMT